MTTTKPFVGKPAPAQGQGKNGDPVEREYNGHPVLTLNPQSRFPFTLGLGKAKLILEQIDAIRAFAAKHQARGTPEKSLPN